MKYLWAYGGTLAAFAVMDLIWLGLIAKNFYRTQLGDLMAQNFQIWAALAFYLVFPVGLVIFAVRPEDTGIGIRGAAIAGALFGFFAYATYDLTNLATLRGWPIALTFVDLAWGTFLSGVSAAVGRWIMLAMIAPSPT